jgi:uncharacterized phiE125 gp8 family phage protein
MTTTIVTPPTVEPVTLDEFLKHARISTSAENAYFETRITAAVEAAESVTRSRCITQTWDDSFDTFADTLCLAQQPVQSITSVTYTNTDGDPTVVAATVYELGQRHGLSFVRLKFEQVWPTDVRLHPDSVVVQYVAGYGLAVDVPTRIKQAIELYTSHFNEMREGETPLSCAFAQMLAPYSFATYPNP